MTRKTRRELAREIEDLRDDEDAVEFQVSSTVVTVTEDMTDERGRLVEDRLPEDDPPEGFEYGRVVPTESAVVTWRELIPVEDADDDARDP
jgi:hypothetical protein